MRFFIFLIFFVVQIGQLNAQFYNTGQEANSLKWYMINNEHFKIVFTEQSDSIAQYVASVLEWSYENISLDMHHKPRKIGVVIHPENATSNGLVSWAPRRIEMFTTPPMDHYPQDWFEQLGIHEFRHVVQIDKLNQGFTRLLYFVFGEQAIGAVLGLYVPLWFLEGDAVWAETQYSMTGRGRQIAFSDPLKVQFLQKGIYSFDKATMDSYKNFVPDHYILGYHFVAEVRRQYGDSVWPNTLNYVARKPFLIVPFSRSLKLNTGLRKKALYNSVMDSLYKKWHLNYLNHPNFNHKMVFTPKSKAFVDYSFPAQISEHVFFALKKSITQIPEFVLIDKSNSKIVEKRIHVPGISDFYNVSFADSMICWEEYRFDPRWEHRRFRVIMTYDMRSKKTNQISHDSWLYYPEFNLKASEIVCFEITPDNHYAIMILNAKTGEIIDKKPIDGMIASPMWSPSDSSIYFVKLSDKGHGIYEWNRNDNTIREHLKPDFYTKVIEWVDDSAIYFTTEYVGSGNLFEFNFKSHQIYQLTNSPFSLKNACSGKSNNIIYAHPTGDGMRLMSCDSVDYIRKAFEVKIPYNDSMFPIDLEMPNIQRDGFELKTYEVKPYKKVKNLFNIHSWGPIGITSSSLETNPGLYFSSQNLLGTSELVAGLGYSRYYNSWAYKFSYSYMGFYPKLDFNYQKIDYMDRVRHKTLDVLSGRVRLPLNFTRGKYVNYIIPSAQLTFQASRNERNRYIGSSYYLSIYAQHLKRKAHRDIYPQNGISFSLISLGFPSNFNSLFATNLNLYFPGLLANQSFRFYWGYQTGQKSVLALVYGDLISMPRFDNLIFLTKIYSVKFDYSLPLFYPDKSLGGLFYFKRVYANLFADFANFGANTNFSYGLDLIVDTHVFRFLSPTKIGIRTAVIPNHGRFSSLIFLTELPD